MNSATCRHCAVGAGLLLLGGMLQPACGTDGERTVALAATPLEAAELEAVRGGYRSTDGLSLSFSLERRIYINGDLESATLLYATNPNVMGAAPADFSTVLQNSLDYQQLRTVTLLEVRMSGYDPVAVSRFEALYNAQLLTAPR